MPLGLLLPLLLVAGCAAPQGRELHRGTTVAPPPPPPVRPGHGAPVVGQPGSFGQPLPRSPHQRELRPSLEPGLWAGDEPRAVRKREPAPELFGVRLPKVPVSGDQFEQEGPARACVAVWNQALPGTGLDAKVQALKPAERRCMVARMNETCARAFERMYDEAGEGGVVMLVYRKYRAATGQAAEEFVLDACEGIPMTPEQRRLLKSLQRRLHDFLHE